MCLGLGLGLGLRLGLVLALELSARSMLTRRDLLVILPETLDTTGWQATGQLHHFQQVDMWASTGGSLAACHNCQHRPHAAAVAAARQQRETSTPLPLPRRLKHPKRRAANS